MIQFWIQNLFFVIFYCISDYLHCSIRELDPVDHFKDNLPIFYALVA